MERYRVLAHTADTAIEAEAASLASLVENLAFGMFDLMFDLAQVPAVTAVEVEVRDAPPADLVVGALSELLFEAESRELAFSTFSAAVGFEGGLRVRAAGLSSSTLELRGPPIKAVTYHDLDVSERAGRWYGRVVFDV